ncbi:MAG: GldG family protein [Treponema sp.]|nr:GldG family protein [Treponema sp.]
MTKKQATILSALTLLALVLTVMVSRRLWFRLDLTKGKSYTISAVSRNLHNEIPDQVRITYFLSDKLRAIHPIPGEIEDLLKEYTAYSRGKIRLTVKDPAKANAAGEVEQFGIMPQQIQTVEQDQASLITVYSGLLIEYLDEIDVMPSVFSLETLEYDLTSRIRSMVRGSSRMLGVVLGDNFRRWNEDYRQLQGAFMQAGYQLRLIPPGADIADTVPALLVLGGVEGLDETALYQIDRYLQTGGRALFTVKGVRVETSGDLEGRLLDDQGLLAMLSSYGVTVLPEIVMDRSALTMQYQTRSPNGMIQIRMTRNPQWIRVLRENSNPDHPVSAHFTGLDMYWASPLSLNAPDGVEAGRLFTTTADAWSMREPYNVNPEIPYLLERDSSETRGRKILGASLAGVFPSWFAGMPKPWQEEGELPDMPFEPKAGRIIVVGDTEFATSFISVSGGQRNLDFLVQAADWLGNDDDIIGIRSRESGSGRLDRIIEPEKRAAAMRTAQAVNVFIVPLLVVLAGIAIALRRRARGAAARSARGGEKEQ